MKSMNEKTKEIRRKKIKILKRKIKKILLTIKNFILKIYNNFQNLNLTTRVIIFVWTFVFVLLLLIALFVGASKDRREKYYNMEEELYNGTLKYVMDKEIYPTENNKANIPLESLMFEKYVDRKLFVDNVDKDKDGTKDNCKGYSIVYYNEDEEQYSIESFVSCNKYTSKYYNDYLDYVEK